MMKLLLIAIFGAAGSLLRYGLGFVIQRAADVSFPLGTLVVNVIGCFAIGFLNALFLAKLVAPEWRVAILVGLLGGFTTFSSYAWETISLSNDNQLGLAFLNIVSTNIIGLTVALLAYRLGQWMFGTA